MADCPDSSQATSFRRAWGMSPQKGSDEILARTQGKAFPSRLAHIDLIEMRQKTLSRMTCDKTSDQIAID